MGVQLFVPFTIPFQASESMTPYLAVKVGSATETARICSLCDAGETAIGIITETSPSSTSGTSTAAAGDTVNVVTCDGAVTYCTVNGTTDIVAGDFLKSAANGVLVKAATAGDYVCAIALAPFATDGTGLIPVMLKTTRIPA